MNATNAMDPKSEMRASVARMFRSTARWTGVRGPDPAVADVMARVPRGRFVPNDLSTLAYANQALPIGRGQTISQPFMVALMTTLLRVGTTDVVLEVGTGSAYQAAVLAQLVGELYSVEIVSELAVSARARLDDLGFSNVTIEVRDGAAGWLEHAPFDGIIVTACSTSVPPALVEQLRVGGRLLIPVGELDGPQHLLLIEKGAGGVLHERPVLEVRFVPLLHHAAPR